MCHRSKTIQICEFKICSFHNSHFSGRIKNQFQRVSAAGLLFLILQFHQYLLCKKVSNAWEIDFLRKIHLIFISLHLLFCHLSQFFFCANISFFAVPVFFCANIAVSARFALGKGLQNASWWADHTPASNL